MTRNCLCLSRAKGVTRHHWSSIGEYATSVCRNFACRFTTLTHTAELLAFKAHCTSAEITTVINHTVLG